MFLSMFKLYSMGVYIHMYVHTYEIHTCHVMHIHEHLPVFMMIAKANVNHLSIVTKCWLLEIHIFSDTCMDSAGKYILVCL